MDRVSVDLSKFPEWQGVQEFESEINRIQSSGAPVTREVALRVMRVIYDGAENSTDQQSGFPFDSCASAIRRLEREVAEGLSEEVF